MILSVVTRSVFLWIHNFVMNSIVTCTVCKSIKILILILIVEIQYKIVGSTCWRVARVYFTTDNQSLCGKTWRIRKECSKEWLVNTGSRLACAHFFFLLLVIFLHVKGSFNPMILSVAIRSGFYGSIIL